MDEGCNDSVSQNQLVDLDDTPTGEEEQAFFENEWDKLEAHSFKQDIKERKAFADRAYAITQTWIGFLIVITFAQMLLRKIDIKLTENEFIVVFTTTTASVFGFWVIVGKYLFNSQSKNKK